MIICCSAALYFLVMLRYTAHSPTYKAFSVSVMLKIFFYPFSLAPVSHYNLYLIHMLFFVAPLATLYLCNVGLLPLQSKR